MSQHGCEQLLQEAGLGPWGSMWAADQGKGIFIFQDRAGSAHHQAGQDPEAPTVTGTSRDILR